MNLLSFLFRKKTAPDFKGLLSKGALIIDVRSKNEFLTGHIGQSRNIPLDELHAKIPDLGKAKKPIITCCRSGTRSSIARSMLQKAGIEAYNGGSWNILDSQL